MAAIFVSSQHIYTANPQTNCDGARHMMIHIKFNGHLQQALSVQFLLKWCGSCRLLEFFYDF